MSAGANSGAARVLMYEFRFPRSILLIACRRRVMGLFIPCQDQLASPAAIPLQIKIASHDVPKLLSSRTKSKNQGNSEEITNLSPIDMSRR